MDVYDGCIPVTVYMVQKYVGGCIFGKWVNTKDFPTRKRRCHYCHYCIVKTNKNKTKWKERR